MQIAGNHQMTPIVGHNDESCNNRIVMTHLDDFLRGSIIGRLERERTQLEVSEERRIALSVIFRLWQRFQVGGNGSRRYRTGRSPSYNAE
ncbi:HTH_Tnp_Tc3_2 domain-containing protein [Trichonephila clavipes]|nr:HTH_Tnp_Tc3_2 domain-containing protein [Trichonephila clavipes]